MSALRVWLTAALLVPAPLAAQGVSAGAVVEHYVFAEPAKTGVAEIEVMASPLDLSVAWGPLSFDAAGGFARARVTNARGGRSELMGPTETEAGITLHALREVVVAHVAVGIPTGTGTQSSVEAGVAGLMASELLPFTLPRWGGQGSWAADVALTANTGPARVRLLAGYRASQPHEILEGEPIVVTPGDETRARVVVDGAVGRAGALSLTAGAQKFAHDAAGPAALFRSGLRLDAGMSLTLPVGATSSAMISTSVLRRRAGSRLSVESTFPGLATTPAYLVVRGTLAARLPRGRLTLLPGGELRVLRAAQTVCYQTVETATTETICPAGQGWMLSAGGTAEIRVAGGRLGPQVVVAPTAGFRMGEVAAAAGTTTDRGSIFTNAAPGAASSVHGWTAGVTLRVVGAP